MRKNNHNNRRRTCAGSKGPAKTAASFTRLDSEGLRILARVIAGAHLRRKASRAAKEPAVPPQGREDGGGPLSFPRSRSIL